MNNIKDLSISSIIEDDIIRNIGPCKHFRWCESNRPAVIDDLCGHWNIISLHLVQRLIYDRTSCWKDLIRH